MGIASNTQTLRLITNGVESVVTGTPSKIQKLKDILVLHNATCINAGTNTYGLDRLTYVAYATESINILYND